MLEKEQQIMQTKQCWLLMLSWRESCSDAQGGQRLRSKRDGHCVNWLQLQWHLGPHRAVLCRKLRAHGYSHRTCVFYDYFHVASRKQIVDYLSSPGQLHKTADSQRKSSRVNWVWFVTPCISSFAEADTTEATCSLCSASLRQRFPHPQPDSLTPVSPPEGGHSPCHEFLHYLQGTSGLRFCFCLWCFFWECTAFK